MYRNGMVWWTKTKDRGGRAVASVQMHVDHHRTGLAGFGWSKRRRPSSAATDGGNRRTPPLLEI